MQAHPPEPLGEVADRLMVSFEDRPCLDCGVPVRCQAISDGQGRVKPWQWQPVIPRCPDCAVRYEARLSHTEEEERKREEERRERDRRKWIEQNDIGLRLAAATFHNFEETEANRGALKAVREWLAKELPPNLMIVGPVGSGKSYLMACAFQELLVGPPPWPVWIRVAKLLALVKEGFENQVAREEAARLFAMAKRAPTLFLDDLGKTHPSRDASWVEDQLFSIVDERYCQMRPTAVTTEWRSAALIDRCGESVTTRLMDGAILASIKRPLRPYRALLEARYDSTRG